MKNCRTLFGLNKSKLEYCILQTEISIHLQIHVSIGLADTHLMTTHPLCCQSYPLVLDLTPHLPLPHISSPSPEDTYTKSAVSEGSVTLEWDYRGLNHSSITDQLFSLKPLSLIGPKCKNEHNAVIVFTW